MRSAATRPCSSNPTARAAIDIISGRLSPWPKPRIAIATINSASVSNSGVMAMATMAITIIASNTQ